MVSTRNLGLCVHEGIMTSCSFFPTRLLLWTRASRLGSRSMCEESSEDIWALWQASRGPSEYNLLRKSDYCIPWSQWSRENHYLVSLWSFSGSLLPLLASVYSFSLQGFPGSSDKEAACSVGDPGSCPGSWWYPEEENGSPLQYSYLENPMDRGAWQTIVHGVAKSWTWLSNFSFFPTQV